MNSQSSTNPRRMAAHTRWAMACIALVTAVSLSACATGTDAGTDSVPVVTESPGDSSEIERAQANIDAHLGLNDSVEAPRGVPIEGLEEFAGRTIAYIPIINFPATLQPLTEAVEAAGMTVQLCDAKGQPTVATQCMDQAIAAGAAGIVTDSLGFDLARNSHAAAVAAGIPILSVQTTDDIPADWKDLVLTTENGQVERQQLLVDTIITDSGGDANVLFAINTSSGPSREGSAGVLEGFEKTCPGCTVTPLEWEPTSLPKTPTAVSVALNADPSIEYVYSQYDLPAVPAIMQGMELSGRSDSLKLLGYGADVAALQRVASGVQLADVGVDFSVDAWNNADRIFRMITGTELPEPAEYKSVTRLFNASNIDTIDPSSNEDFLSGAWYSDGSWRSSYLEAWGVN